MLIAISLKQVLLNMAYQHLFNYLVAQKTWQSVVLQEYSKTVKLDKELISVLFNCANHLDKHPETAEKLLGSESCEFEQLKPILRKRCSNHDPLIAVRSMLMSDLKESTMGGDTEVRLERYYKTMKCFNEIGRKLELDVYAINRIIVAPDIINSDVP